MLTDNIILDGNFVGVGAHIRKARNYIKRYAGVTESGEFMWGCSSLYVLMGTYVAILAPPSETPGNYMTILAPPSETPGNYMTILAPPSERSIF